MTSQKLEAIKKELDQMTAQHMEYFGKYNDSSLLEGVLRLERQYKRALRATR
jgi:hypothetical protein